MASLTVRQLDDRLKQRLRLRAARHGRSMEDEIRGILRAAAQDAGEETDELEPPARLSSREEHRQEMGEECVAYHSSVISN